MEIVRSIKHPEEVLALLKFKLGGCQSIMPKCDMVSWFDHSLILSAVAVARAVAVAVAVGVSDRVRDGVSPSVSL